MEVPWRFEKEHIFTELKFLRGLKYFLNGFKQSQNVAKATFGQFCVLLKRHVPGSPGCKQILKYHIYFNRFVTGAIHVIKYRS